ncbi:MAG: S8 family serine peptidase [Ignavibacteriaceae bacterium]
MKYLFILFLFLTSQVLSQDKYFIYFKDKGVENGTVLNKTSLAYSDAIKNLTEKSIDRRKKSMGEDFITFEDLSIHKNYINELKSNNIKVIRELNWFNSVSAYLTFEQIEIVKNLFFVKSVEPVKKLYFKKDFENIVETQLYKLSDTLYNYGLSFRQMDLSDVPIVHSKNINGKDVIIGVLDSGFDWKFHESLKDRNVVAEYDFIFDDNVTANQIGDNPSQDSHGTYVFSILAGFSDSVLIGPAFNSSFILAKTEDIRSETHIEEDNYAAALIWMESLGVDITTGSLGYNIFDNGYSYTYADMDGRTAIVTKASELAFQRGVATFTSAGNEGNNSWGYIIAPADGFNIISVGAINDAGNAASFSSHGPTYDGRIKPEVVAYGVSNYGAIAGTLNGYKFSSGTSAAAPIVSGIAAMLLSQYPYLKNTQIRSILLETSSNSANPNNQIGYGIISAKNAIEFPNLEFENGGFVIHKSILENNLVENSVKIVFQIADDLYESFPMSKEGSVDFVYQLPIKNIGDNLKFSFSYADSQNNIYTYPQSGNFNLNYGSDIISLNVDVPSAVDFGVVSDFFPNPFIPADHKYVRLNFQSTGNEIFKLAIIDGAGQKVKEYSSLSIPGTNYFDWDGYADRGYLCASGVYYALIQFGGKEYGKKLILLK